MYSWDNIWIIVTKPDNIPILMLIVALVFFTAYALRDAFRNDRLIKAGRKHEILRQMQE